METTKILKVTKTLFIVPTDAHYYKILEMLKQFKIIILAPTCFGSHRNHHHGAVLCLAKLQIWFFCARRYRPVFLNGRAAARYRALASIIAGREKFSWNLSF